MFDNWDYLLTQIISTVGSFASVTSYQEALNARNAATGDAKEKKAEKPASTTRKENFFLKYSRTIIIIVCSIVLIIVIAIIKEATTNPQPKKLEVTPTLCKDVSPITCWPIKRSKMDSWLDDMDNYVSHDGAFYMRKWNDYIQIRIKNQIYPHCIGITIPFEKLENYYSKANPDQQVHTEYIEYSLGYAYKTLQFDYGIDDLSFPNPSLGHPRCEFRIIVDSCDSNGFVSSTQNHLFDTDWLNYRCYSRRTPEMDVSQCETVRITVMWRFYVRQNGPIAFYLVIANPLLRAAKYSK